MNIKTTEEILKEAFDNIGKDLDILCKKFPNVTLNQLPYETYNKEQLIKKKEHDLVLEKIFK